MISFRILNIREFMTRLLLRDTFDHFYLTEASVTTFGTFFIDGRLQKDYYTSEEIENGDLSHPYSYWSQMRPFCLDLMKGKKTPLNFKIVFSLSRPNTEKFLRQTGTSLNIADIGGLYLNLRYDGQQLDCITGTALNVFTMDKSLEHAWDEMVRKFFRAKNITVEP